MPQWYDEVGKSIVLTQIINSVMPPVFLMLDVLIAKILRAIDIGTCGEGDKYKTKCTTMAAYKTIWGGPKHLIHF